MSLHDIWEWLIHADLLIGLRNLIIFVSIILVIVFTIHFLRVIYRTLSNFQANLVYRYSKRLDTIQIYSKYGALIALAVFVVLTGLNLATDVRESYEYIFRWGFAVTMLVMFIGAVAIVYVNDLKRNYPPK